MNAYDPAKPSGLGHNNPITAIATAIMDQFSQKDRLPPSPSNERLEGKTVLVTGANSGLGKAAAIELAKRGARVIMGCRSGIPEAGHAVKRASGGEVSMRPLDLSDLAKVKIFTDGLRDSGVTLDVTVLNAGLMAPKAVKSAQGFEMMFAVHYLANQYLLSQLLKDGTIPNTVYAGKPATGDRPRIIAVSSEAHRSAEPIDFAEFGAFKPHTVGGAMAQYGHTKLALNILMQELSRRLAASEAPNEPAVFHLCPGPIASNIARDAPAALRAPVNAIMKLMFPNPEKAAAPVIYFAASPDVEEDTGAYLHMMRRKPPSPASMDEVAARRLWAFGETVFAEHGL